MSTSNGGEVLALTDTLGYLAYSQSISPDERVRRVRDTARFMGQCIEIAGEPADTGEYIKSLRLRSWLACLPSLEAVAAGLPHHADIAQVVLKNLLPTLEETVIENTRTINNFRGNETIHGQIAEMAVLATILWSHSVRPDRVRRSILPASYSQDQSKEGSIASGFDLLLDTQSRFVPLQVKSTDLTYKSRQRLGFSGRPYRKDIAVIYVSRLVGKDYNPHYAPQILADAVIKEDENLLTNAIDEIDIAVEKAKLRTVEASSLYRT